MHLGLRALHAAKMSLALAFRKGAGNGRPDFCGGGITRRDRS